MKLVSGYYHGWWEITIIDLIFLSAWIQPS